MSSSVDLTDRVALITGASRGIGRAVALGMAAAGAHVVLVARTQGALEELDDEISSAGGSATLVPMDLTKFLEVDKLGPAMMERFGRLDIFVGNAGTLGKLAPVHHADHKDFEMAMRLNFTANIRLVRTLDPLLRASDSGRVIFTGTDSVDMCSAYWGTYAASKAALEAFAKIYAAETLKTNMRINIVRPGAVDTAMLDAAFPGGFQGEAKAPEEVVSAFLDLAAFDCTCHGEIVGL